MGSISGCSLDKGGGRKKVSPFCLFAFCVLLVSSFPLLLLLLPSLISEPDFLEIPMWTKEQWLSRNPLSLLHQMGTAEMCEAATSSAALVCSHCWTTQIESWEPI